MMKILAPVSLLIAAAGGYYVGTNSSQVQVLVRPAVQVKEDVVIVQEEDYRVLYKGEVVGRIWLYSGRSTHWVVMGCEKRFESKQEAINFILRRW